MLIAIWDNESEATLNFVNTAENFAEVLLYEDLESLHDASEEEVDLIVFDYDSDKNAVDKFIKKFKKNDDETKILILSNVLAPKQLIKHQNSKSGGDIYLRTPVTLDLLKSIFEPFFDIAIEVEESNVEGDDIPATPKLSRADQTVQKQVIDEHQKVEMTEEAQEASDAIQKKFDIVFPLEEDKAAAALREIEEQEKQEAEQAESEMLLEDGLSLDNDVGEDDLILGDESDTEELSLGEDLDEGLSLIDNSEEDALSLGDDSDDEELSLGDDLDEDATQEAILPDEDDLIYPDLSTDMLKADEETEENQEIENIEDTKEPDMSGHDEQDLEIDNLDGLELAADDETPQVAEADEGMDLSLDDGEGLDLAADGDDVDLTATVEDDSELDLGADDGVLELSADGDSPESVEVVTDELDLDASSEEVVEEDSLDLGGGDDESLELGADEEDALDLGGDDESLDLGADEEDALDLGGDEESLDLGGDDESLDLGGDDESLDLGGEEEDSLDLGSDAEDDGLNFEQETPIEQDLTGELEFGVNGDNIDEVAQEANLSATDLPAAPDGLDDLDDLAFGSGDTVDDQDLSFDSDSTEEHSDDIMAKLAEIDAMMDDAPVAAATQDEATVEHEISPELHAQSQLDEIDEMTKVIPTPLEEESLEETSEDTNVMQQLDDATGVDDFNTDDLNFSAQEEEIEEPIQAAQEDSIPQTPAQEVTPPAAVNVAEHMAYKEHHGEELTRYGETIKNLRDEREELLNQIQQLQEKNESLKRDQLAMKAELDEKKIELSIVKKRHEKQVDELKYHLDISNDKREVLEEKNKQFEREYENLNRKIKVDLNKVRSRERDLENKLEMLRSDAELQIRNRDQKILELKRKIDTLQFDVESIQVSERKVSTNNHQLEDKMQKVIRTLRRAIGELEEDGSSIRSIEEIKKNLDV
jgi:hypothetical protein